MKLKFKSLQGSTFTVDAESTDSVRITTVEGKNAKASSALQSLTDDKYLPFTILTDFRCQRQD